MRKRNEKNEIVRYKARFIAQELSQRLITDYGETYSLVVDAMTFRYLISLVIHEKLDMCQMNIVTAYLHGSFDTEIYMKIPKEFTMPKACKVSKENCLIKLNKSLYRLKKFRLMWYNHLSKYFRNEGYKNDPICPFIFIKGYKLMFVIIVIYVDDIIIIGTPKELQKAVNYLKKEFEMKDLKTNFCLSL